MQIRVENRGKTIAGGKKTKNKRKKKATTDHSRMEIWKKRRGNLTQTVRKSLNGRGLSPTGREENFEEISVDLIYL